VKLLGYFYCQDNQLTSLEGTPKKVGGNFSCSNNNLTSLEGSPERLGSYFNCSRNINNLLTDVRGFPEYYRGEIYINGNPVFEIIQLFKGVSTDIIIETLNDYNVIRHGKKVNLQLLKYTFDELEIVMPEIEYIEGYEII
jgi:hypothetical protein